jgi:hypothetical protein
LKNQYFGDINDYIKYGLLRILADVTKQKIGVCWMLTADDDGGDGQKINYLKKQAEYQKFDSELFDHLCKIHDGQLRDVKYAKIWNIINDAEYFEEELKDILTDRECYFANAHTKLEACPIIFFDPDNGLEVASVKKGSRKSSKFIYFDELESFLIEGKTLIN